VTPQAPGDARQLEKSAAAPARCATAADSGRAIGRSRRAIIKTVTCFLENSGLFARFFIENPAPG